MRGVTVPDELRLHKRNVSAIAWPEVDADQIGKKLPIPGAACAVNIDVEQNGCRLVKYP
jgi:hypothetical protein